MDARSKPGERRDARDRRSGWFGIAFTLVIHGLLIAMLATAGGTGDGMGIAFPGEHTLCDGIRCAETPFLRKRRGIVDVAAVDLGMIEATIIPRLGMAEPKPGALPKLVKYEQPEKIDEAVNIAKEPVQKKELPPKDVKAKPAERDRKRQDSLTDILGAPKDDDPRKRPTALSRIVGSPDGSVHGQGTEWREGNVYAGKVAMALRQQFTVPPFLTDSDLRKLRVRVRVLRMNSSGQIQEFEMVEQSADARFNSAAVQAVRKFVPKDGGTVYLPAPDQKTLEYINSRGMIIDLDGALFRR
jgi:hypothetical protein